MKSFIKDIKQDSFNLRACIFLFLSFIKFLTNIFIIKTILRSKIN